MRLYHTSVTYLGEGPGPGCVSGIFRPSAVSPCALDDCFAVMDKLENDRLNYKENKKNHNVVKETP